MKVLIADRSHEIRQRIKHLVKEIYTNSKIYETESNLEAMTIAQLHKPNLVITDLDLYKGSGLYLLAYLNGLTLDCLKIVFTNHDKHDIKKISTELGADFFLSKAHDFIKIRNILTQNNIHNNNKIN